MGGDENSRNTANVSKDSMDASDISKKLKFSPNSTGQAESSTSTDGESIEKKGEFVQVFLRIRPNPEQIPIQKTRSQRCNRSRFP